MTPAARVAAAIEVLETIAIGRLPAGEALKEWGRARRFAGSGDRAHVASLVFDALRHKASAAWLMEGDAPRGVMLGALRLARGMEVEAIAALCLGEGHAPAKLTPREAERLATGTLEGAPDHVRMCAAIIPNGWRRASPLCSANTRSPKAGPWLSARPSICAPTPSRGPATRRSNPSLI